MLKLKKFIIVICLVVMSVFVTSCTTTTQDIIVKIHNEITNKVVDYQNITITGMENAVKETIESVGRAVVGISAKEVSYVGVGLNKVESHDTVAIGSGVIYKREEILNEAGVCTNFKYYVITNKHVILDDNNEKSYVIYIYDGVEDVEIRATVVGYDPKVDIALLTFEYNVYIDPVEFGDHTELKKGNFVIAMGNPVGFTYYNSATFGIISGDIRYIKSDTDEDGVNDFVCEYVQHDASISPGNSGGGIFGLDGKLYGINTLKIVATYTEGVGLAIPSNIVKTIVTEYLEKGVEIVRPRLGCTGIPVNSLTPAVIYANGLKNIPNKIFEGASPYGIYVTENILPESTLATTEIEKDDIILTFDGIKIKTFDDISAKFNGLVEYKIGDEVEITYYDRSEDIIKIATIILKTASK